MIICQTVNSSLRASSAQAEGHCHSPTLCLGFRVLQCSPPFLLSIRAQANHPNITPAVGVYLSLGCSIAFSYKGSFPAGSLALPCRRQCSPAGKRFCPGLPHGHLPPLFPYRAGVHYFFSRLQVLMTEKLFFIYFIL